MAQQTPLYETHLKYGGKMVEFGGWLLPVQYSGIIAEHRAVRENAGLFDVSHMGEIQVKGPDALAYLEKIVTNAVSRLADTQVLYSPMCYANGGTVDDLLIYRYGPEHYLLVVNAANIEKDWEWLGSNKTGFNVELVNLSQEIAQLALQGPLAQAVVGSLTTAPLADLNYYWFLPEVEVAGTKVMLSRTGYTGEDGFEIYCQPGKAADLWEAIIAAGASRGVLPAGLGCRDTLRFEACLPLYGHELSADISPLEAGLSRFVKLEKGEFNGRVALAAQKEQGLKRKIAGLVLVERGVARAEYPVFVNDRRVGTVTTGSYCPSLDKNLALALVKAEAAEVGRKVAVEIRGKKVEAEVISKPFYKREER